MVKYNEFKNLNESVDTDKITHLLATHFRVNIDDCIIKPNGVVDNLTHKSRVRLTSTVNGKIPVKFGKIRSHFSCSNTGLTTLENAPEEVGGNFFCTENNLTSFEHAPKNLYKATVGNGSFYGYANPLQSLKGIEMDTIVSNIEVDYFPEMPLLRLLVANEVVSFPKITSKLEPATEVENILNQHIQEFPNLKERIIKCQYALMKAGFKANAKW